MPRCKAPEILRSEAYLNVRCKDEGLGKRRRWAFFNSLSRTPYDVLRPQAIGAGRVPAPTSFIAFAEIATLTQIAVRARGEMKSPYLAAKAHIFLRHPDFR